MLYFFTNCPRPTARNYLVTFKYFLPKNVSRDVAHKFDYKNHAADGVRGLATHEQQWAGSEVMRNEFASLRAADESGIPTLLDTYGATNPAEFFAVSTEAFFERPHALRARHPKLYAELQKYFQQDPVEYSAER